PLEERRLRRIQPVIPGLVPVEEARRHLGPELLRLRDRPGRELIRAREPFFARVGHDVRVLGELLGWLVELLLTSLLRRKLRYSCGIVLGRHTAELLLLFRTDSSAKT